MTPGLLLGHAAALDLYGHGTVGRRFSQLAHAAGLKIATIHTRAGPLQVEPVEAPRRILIDATPPHYSGPAAGRWVHFLEEALLRGTDIVTCNKAPLATSWRRLAQAARDGGSRLVHTATVGGGTPILPLVRRLGQGFSIEHVEASLSGTLRHVIGQVAAGKSLAAAIADAQRLGYAEPDPTLDLDGTDAWAKGVILHNCIYPAAPIELSDARPPLALDVDAIQAAHGTGRISQPILHIRRGQIRLEVEERTPELALPGRGVDACVRVQTTAGARFDLVGPGAGADVTAAALLADVQQLLGANP